MAQYLLLIQNDAKSQATPAEWDAFLVAARASGMFEGGSALGEREVIGDVQSAKSTHHIGGYMRFDTNDKAKLLELLRRHPVVVHGGSVELCAMPRT